MSIKDLLVRRSRGFYLNKKFMSLMVTVGVLAIVGTLAVLQIDKMNMKADIGIMPDLFVSQTSVTYEGANGSIRTVESNPVQAVVSKADFTFTKAGWYLISLPKQPDVSLAMTEIFKNINIDGTVYRWNVSNQGLVNYDSYSEPDGPFGVLKSGDGFWIKIGQEDVGKSLSFAGSTLTGTQEISLKLLPSLTKGWAIVGNPFDHDIVVNEKVFVSNGTETKSFCQAAQAGWIDDVMYGWDLENQGLKTIGCEFADSSVMSKAGGYWIQFHSNNLKLTIRP